MLMLALLAVAVMALSGVASLVLPRGKGAPVFVALMVLASACGLWAGIGTLRSGASAELTLLLPLLPGFRLDPLAAAFLLPVCLIPALAALYGVTYWSDAHEPRSARRVRLFLGLLAGAMGTVVLARDAIVLLYAWEIMALATFFLVVARDEDPEVRRAGWIYFVSTHVGTLALLALFALLRVHTGSHELTRLAASALDPATTTTVLVLALLGFGLKAGIVPLHVWLPGAHANAPSHVSAVLSGVLLKIGVYGLVRILWMMPAVPRAWAAVLFGLGAVTCVFGIALAAAQSDYKRLLAYSSIENIGVILLALGLFALGLADGEPALATLGLAAAILHVWNHALFKPLLFLVAGALLHATETRAMSRLGGLARKMPRVAALAALACLAICALPPLNGFVSEWLLYSGLLRGTAQLASAWGGGLAAVAVVLAMTGALAVLAFVKLFAMVFLGAPRSEAGAHARDPRWPMLAPMLLLALLCLAVGSAPLRAVELAVRTTCAWSELEPATDLVGSDGLARIGSLSAALLLVTMLGTSWLAKRVRAGGRERPVTWDCGFAAPSARMQYGPASLVQAFVGLFAWVIVPRREQVEGPEGVEADEALREQGPFPLRARHGLETPDVVLDRGVLPMLRGAARAAVRLRVLQKGAIQVYVLYILFALLGLFFVR